MMVTVQATVHVDRLPRPCFRLRVLSLLRFCIREAVEDVGELRVVRFLSATRQGQRFVRDLLRLDKLRLGDQKTLQGPEGSNGQTRVGILLAVNRESVADLLLRLFASTLFLQIPGVVD